MKKLRPRRPHKQVLSGVMKYENFPYEGYWASVGETSLEKIAEEFSGFQVRVTIQVVK